MATQKLFGNHVPPACRYCGYSLKYIVKGDSCLCEKKGVVAGDYKCRGFLYDPLKRMPLQKMPQREFKEEEFAL